MMASASSTSAATPPPPQDRPLNTAAPIPLSAAQEAQVRALYYKRVRSHCAAEIKEFADCARNRTFTATWACRDQQLAMNGCMIKHAGQEEEDRAREEWLSSRTERRQKRLAEEKAVEGRRREVLAMMERDRVTREGEEEEKKKKKKEKDKNREKQGSGGRR